jgi:hypothetical protein
MQISHPLPHHQSTFASPPTGLLCWFPTLAHLNTTVELRRGVAIISRFISLPRQLLPHHKFGSYVKCLRMGISVLLRLWVSIPKLGSCFLVQRLLPAVWAGRGVRVELGSQTRRGVQGNCDGVAMAPETVKQCAGQQDRLSQRRRIITTGRSCMLYHCVVRSLRDDIGMTKRDLNSRSLHSALSSEVSTLRFSSILTESASTNLPSPNPNLALIVTTSQSSPCCWTAS